MLTERAITTLPSARHSSHAAFVPLSFRASTAFPGRGFVAHSNFGRGSHKLPSPMPRPRGRGTSVSRTARSRRIGAFFPLRTRIIEVQFPIIGVFSPTHRRYRHPDPAPTFTRIPDDLLRLAFPLHDAAAFCGRIEPHLNPSRRARRHHATIAHPRARIAGTPPQVPVPRDHPVVPRRILRGCGRTRIVTRGFSGRFLPQRDWSSFVALLVDPAGGRLILVEFLGHSGGNALFLVVFLLRDPRPRTRVDPRCFLSPSGGRRIVPR
jgi:hypothetical protein